MVTVSIEVSKPYEVVIDTNLLAYAGKHLAPWINERNVLIVTDEHLVQYGHLDRLVDSLQIGPTTIETIVLAPGEAQKSWHNVQMLVERLAQAQFTRQDLLIALGGGVIGDLVGFTASIYLRGINYVQIPTTFLAAIDSSVGGKTAIDIDQGKNLVGAFYHPAKVLCDVSTFGTLPRAIFEDGCSELIKYAMIMNPSLLDKLLEEDALSQDDASLVAMVQACVEMKRRLVLEDEKDHGVRQLLNFGHTLGHALEQLSHYAISHGRAVALGMTVFTKLSKRLGILPQSSRLEEDLDELLSKYQLLLPKPAYSSNDLVKTMLSDKKRLGNHLTLVLPNAVGSCVLQTLPIESFLKTFEEVWIDD